MPITYLSTRGGETGLRFDQVVLGGLAKDKGLYIPESIDLSQKRSAEFQFNNWNELPGTSKEGRKIAQLVNVCQFATLTL